MDPKKQPSGRDSLPNAPSRWRFGVGHLLLLAMHLGLLLGLINWLGFSGFFLFVLFWITWRLYWGNQQTALRVLRLLTFYGILSLTTLPLKNAWWIGEMPMFVLPQTPKTQLANELRRTMVTHLLGPMGLSRGSFSPDWTLVRPYALALVYLVPLIVWMLLIARRTGINSPYCYWILVVLLLALADYLTTLTFANGPGLSFY